MPGAGDCRAEQVWRGLRATLRPELGRAVRSDACGSARDGTKHPALLFVLIEITSFLNCCSKNLLHKPL